VIRGINQTNLFKCDEIRGIILKLTCQNFENGFVNFVVVVGRLNMFDKLAIRLHNCSTDFAHVRPVHREVVAVTTVAAELEAVRDQDERFVLGDSEKFSPVSAEVLKSEELRRLRDFFIFSSRDFTIWIFWSVEMFFGFLGLWKLICSDVTVYQVWPLSRV
jgi:hypothetical protein